MNKNCLKSIALAGILILPGMSHARGYPAYNSFVNPQNMEGSYGSNQNMGMYPNAGVNNVIYDNLKQEGKNIKSAKKILKQQLKSLMKVIMKADSDFVPLEILNKVLNDSIEELNEAQQSIDYLSKLANKSAHSGGISVDELSQLIKIIVYNLIGNNQAKTINSANKRDLQYQR